MDQIFQAPRIIELTSTDSTNNYAANLLKQGKEAEGTAILSYYQTKGRGQRGAYWESAKGQNLTFSIILYPNFIPLKNQFTLHKIVAVSIVDFLQEQTRSKVRIKWPNDILVNQHKVSGVLIENSLSNNIIEHSIIGIGLNLNQRNFENPKATSLRAITGNRFDILSTCREICSRILRNYYMLNQNGSENIDASYLNLLFGLGEERLYRYRGEEIYAKIKGLNEAGKLILTDDKSNLIQCDLREIEFIY